MFVPKPNFERMWRISHKQPLKHKCRKSANKQSAITTAGFIILLLLVVNAGFMEMDFFLLLAGAVLFDVLINGNSARLFGIMLHVKQDLSHCRILQKV